MRDDESAAYKTVRGLSRGLLLLKLLAINSTAARRRACWRSLAACIAPPCAGCWRRCRREGFVRRSRSDDSFRLTINVRQLSDGFRDEHWISALATPLLGELLREVQWPTDITTLDVDAMVVRETTHRFSRLSFHRAMVGRRLPLLLTASGLTWLAFAPDAERDAVVSMLAARPEAEYQLAREPERLAAILARTRQNGYGENFRGWRQEEKIASIAVPVCSQQRVIGCLNLVYIASAMTIEQAAQKHLPALQRVARQIEARMEDEEVWYEMP
ncbi:DNA-binding transcriptional regulator [Klebsiella pneumoniae subsp. pneumoniae]|nr:DNA-binding transcriptional regulator [Klebsiella pneumoniae subsp. pneumoniae]